VGVGFPRGKDVISGGINQSTPSRSGLEVKERMREKEGRETKGESELRYETKENLAKPRSPPPPVFTTDRLPLLPPFLLPFPPHRSLPTPSHPFFSLHRLLFTVEGSGGEGQRLDAAHR